MAADAIAVSELVHAHQIRYRGVLDISNAREQLGYAPRFARLEDGVEHYVNEYRRYREAACAWT